MGYNWLMFNVLETAVFSKWLKKLKDPIGKAAVIRGSNQMRKGNFGDAKSVGEGVFERRYNIGPGYRVYYIQEGEEIILLLMGGDKSNQQNDINKAKEMAKERKNGTG